MYFSKWLGFRSLLTLAACLVLSLSASAQSGKGAIRGRVSDPSGGALIGAEIVLQQNDVSVVSDAQGQFFINNLEAGTYTVEISYVGFSAVKKDVVVAAGQTANVDTKLEVASVNWRYWSQRNERPAKWKKSIVSVAPIMWCRYSHRM